MRKDTVLRQNANLVRDELVRLGYPVGNIKVKPSGGGAWKVWTDDGLFQHELDSFDWKGMGDMCESMIHAFATTEEDLQSSWGSYHEYTLLATGQGDDFINPTTLHEVDGRMDNWNESEMDNFWQDDWMGERVDEIIGNHPLQAYHRKGKDWAVAPAVDTVEVEYTYLTEGYDGEIDDRTDYWSMDGVPYHLSDTDVEVAKEVAEFLQGCKADLEYRCAAANARYRCYSAVAFHKSVDYGPYDTDSELYEIAEKLHDHWKETGKTHRFPDGDDIYAEFLLREALTDDTPVYNQHQLERWCRRMGLEWEFDVDYTSKTIRLEPLDSTENYHVSDDEFVDSGQDWGQVFRDTVIPQMRRREQMAAQSKRRLAIDSDILTHAKQVWVAFADSLNAGNCLPGTKKFCIDHGIDPDKLGAIRGDWLLEMADDVFTRRVIYGKLGV